MDSVYFKRNASQFKSLFPFCVKFLTTWSECEFWTPWDFNTIANTCLSSSQLMQWICGFLTELNLSLISVIMEGVQLSSKLLIRGVTFLAVHKWVSLPYTLLELFQKIVLCAWEKVDMETELKSILQKDHF